MTKKNKKIILITSMITILPILAGLILWNKLPEQVATHFDANGIPNGYSSRAFAVFGPYLICLFAHLFCAFGTLADPKKQAICDHTSGTSVFARRQLSAEMPPELYRWHKGSVDTRQRSKLGCNPQDGRKIVGCRRRVDSSAGHSAVDPGISDKSGAHTCGHIYSDDLFLCILSEK